MWTKTRRINRLLGPLASMIGGTVANGEVIGSYAGYGVEARPHRGFPIQQVPTGQPNPPGQVDMLRLTLTGVRGRAIWHCQSSAGSLLQDAVSRFTGGRLLRGFQPGEFKFERVDFMREAGERKGAKLARAFGVPIDHTPDDELQERLIASGLFDELSALRWGAHPYLPKAEFTPPASELVHLYKHSPAFARVEPKMTERLRTAGLPDLDSLLEQRMADAAASSPGKLVIDVEVGNAKVPSPERFRELLDHAVRIAQINAQANPPSQAG
jgi:hypothetical protein